MADQTLAELLMWAAKHGARDNFHQNATAGSHQTATQKQQKQKRTCLDTTVAVAMFPEAGGRGLAAVRDLTAGEVVLAIPESLLMTAKSGRADPVLGPLLKRAPQLTSHQVLILHLLHEVSKGAASFWHPYLLALPREHHTLALFSPSQVLQLQVPQAIDAARGARTDAHRDWAAAKGVLRELGLPQKFCRFGAWLWASATVTSRTVAIPFDLSGALCPVGDLFNYAAPSAEDQTTRLTDGAFDENIRSFCFYAREDYRKGQQVLLSYGAYRNLDLLEHYGFLLPTNPNDAVTIPLPASITPTAASQGNFVDGQIGGSEIRSECHIKVDGQPSFSLLSALRLRAASTKERRKHGHLASAGVQISVEGDIGLYRWLGRTCQSLLLDLPTSLEDDLSQQNEFEESEHGSTCRSTSCRSFDRLEQCRDGERGDCLECSWPLALQWRVGHKRMLWLAVLHTNNQLKELESLSCVTQDEFNALSDGVHGATSTLVHINFANRLWEKYEGQCVAISITAL